MALPKLLITGHRGLIGRILWRGLADAFELYGVDICLSEQAGNVFRADILKPEQVNAVFERIHGLAYVVHLAADPRVDADWQSVLVSRKRKLCLKRLLSQPRSAIGRKPLPHCIPTARFIKNKCHNTGLPDAFDKISLNVNGVWKASMAPRHYCVYFDLFES